MKKIITIVLSIVMVLSLCTLTAFAEATPAKVEKATELYNDLNKSVDSVKATLKEEGGVKFVNFDVTGNADPWLTFTTPLDVGAANKYAVVRYRTSSAAVTSIDFYIKVAEPHSQNIGVITDGEWHNLVCDLEKPFPDSMPTLWDGTIARFDMMNGSGSDWAIDIAWIAFFDNQDDAEDFTGADIVDDTPAQTHQAVAILDNGGGAIGTWINSGKTSASVKFTTAGSFNAINLGVYWASNPVVGNGPKAEWKCELFAFEYNTENTLSKAPVKTKTVISDGDANPPFAFDLEEDMPAGTYILKFTLTNPEYTESLQAANESEPKDKTPYLVLPKIANPDESKFAYDNDPFNIILNGEIVEGDFFLANPEETEAPNSIIDESKYDVSYKLNKDNATNWAGGNINGIDVTYFFKVEDDGLAVAVRGIGLKDGEYVQLNFNPGNYLWETPGQFISVVLGDTLKIMQHNHKNGLLADDSAGGADITDKVANEVLKTADGYEVVFKLPKALFTITDVEGADAFVYGEDDLYFGMFLVAGGGGLTNQAQGPGSDWTCKGLNLVEYVFEGTPAQTTEPETNTQTGDFTVAMFAVIAVLAMGAAVVFMKKRAF